MNPKLETLRTTLTHLEPYLEQLLINLGEVTLALVQLERD